MNTDYSEIKRAAEQRKSELDHFGMPGSFSVDPKVLLDLLAEIESLKDQLADIGLQYRADAAFHEYVSEQS